MTPNLSVVIAVLPAVVVGLILPLAIVGLVAYGVAELVRAGSDRSVDEQNGERDGTATPSASFATPAASPAITILDERFARGEIDTEDYVERRELLLASIGNSAPTAAAPTAAAPADVGEATSTSTAEVDQTAAGVPTAAEASTSADEGAPETATMPPVEDTTAEQPSAGDHPTASA